MIDSIESSCLYDCSPGKVSAIFLGWGSRRWRRDGHGRLRFLSWVGRGVDAPLGAPTPWATGRSSLVGQWTRGREGEAMEGPGWLRRKTAMPVSMGVVRHSGCSTSTPALRQPRASERTWKRREIISVWGSLDHQKCPAIRRYGGVDSIPSLGGMSSPRATTAESLGTMALLSSMTPCSWALPEGARMMRRVSGARTWQGPLERASQFLSGNLPWPVTGTGRNDD